MKRLSGAALLVVCLSVVPARTQDAITGVWEGEMRGQTRPAVMAIDFERSTVSFDGADPATPMLRITADAVEFDQPAGGGRTLRFSGRRSGDTITGTVTGGTRELPFSLARLPVPTPSPNRVVAWREDLDAVRNRVLRYDRSFSAPARAAAVARLERLETSVAGLTDQQILVELSRLIALAGNAHTRLYFARNRTEVTRLPIRVWWFRDDLRIVRATAAHADLLGCRVLRIGQISAGDAFTRVRDIKSGNASWQRYMSTYFLTSGDVLAGSGVIREAGRMPFAIDCNGVRKQVTIASLPLRRSKTAVEAWWDLAPAHPAVDPALRPVLPADRAPRHLRRAHENYWFEYVPELQAIYVQYNRSEPSSTQPMADFVARLANAVRERPLKAFIIDVRFNTGGNLNTGTPLVDTISPLLKGIPAFVLTGRSTFSAGITHTAQWKQAGATLVGEPVGDGLDMWSEGGNLVLPHSRLTVHYTNAFHRYSTKDYPDNRPYFMELRVPSLDPDMRVEPDWEDYLAGRDPLLAAIAQRLSR